jgi:hypothetical protein
MNNHEYTYIELYNTSDTRYIPLASSDPPHCLSSTTFNDSMTHDPKCRISVASGVSGPSKQAALKGIM